MASEQAAIDWPTSSVALKDINDSDVIFGRGAKANRLRKGGKYETLVHHYAVKYMAEPPIAKRAFVRDNIIDPIKQVGGRFFNQDKEDGDAFIEIKDALSETTVMQALRDRYKASITEGAYAINKSEPCDAPVFDAYQSLLPDFTRIVENMEPPPLRPMESVFSAISGVSDEPLLHGKLLEESQLNQKEEMKYEGGSTGIGSKDEINAGNSNHLGSRIQQLEGSVQTLENENLALRSRLINLEQKHNLHKRAEV